MSALLDNFLEDLFFFLICTHDTTLLMLSKAIDCYRKGAFDGFLTFICSQIHLNNIGFCVH